MVKYFGNVFVRVKVDYGDVFVRVVCGQEGV